MDLICAHMLIYFATSAPSLRVKPHTNLPLTTHRSKKNKQPEVNGQKVESPTSPLEDRNKTYSSGYAHICTYIRSILNMFSPFIFVSHAPALTVHLIGRLHGTWPMTMRARQNNSQDISQVFVKVLYCCGRIIT